MKVIYYILSIVELFTVSIILDKILIESFSFYLIYKSFIRLLRLQYILHYLFLYFLLDNYRYRIEILLFE